MSFYGLLADILSAIHLALMVYVVLGQLLILVGILFRWGWIRNPWFRWTHMAAILTVAAEALLGIMCPLTNWELDLRRLAGEPDDARSFTARLVHKFLFPLDEFPDADPVILTLGYYGFALLVLITFVLMPPGTPAPRGRVGVRLRCPGKATGVPGNGQGSVAAVSVDRPEQGANTQTVVCPGCSEPVGIHVKSRRHFWARVGLLALLGAAITCLGFFLPHLQSLVTGEAIPLTGSGRVWRSGWENAVTVLGLLILVLAPSGLLVRRALIGEEKPTTDPRTRHRVLA
jgi:hypothetical protein